MTFIGFLDEPSMTNTSLIYLSNMQFWEVTMSYFGYFLVHFKHFIWQQSAINYLAFFSCASNITYIKIYCEPETVYANHTFNCLRHDSCKVFGFLPENTTSIAVVVF